MRRDELVDKLLDSIENILKSLGKRASGSSFLTRSDLQNLEPTEIVPVCKNSLSKLYSVSLESVLKKVAEKYQMRLLLKEISEGKFGNNQTETVHLEISSFLSKRGPSDAMAEEFLSKPEIRVIQDEDRTSKVFETRIPSLKPTHNSDQLATPRKLDTQQTILTEKSADKLILKTKDGTINLESSPALARKDLFFNTFIKGSKVPADPWRTSSQADSHGHLALVCRETSDSCSTQSRGLIATPSRPSRRQLAPSRKVVLVQRPIVDKKRKVKKTKELKSKEIQQPDGGIHAWIKGAQAESKRHTAYLISKPGDEGGDDHGLECRSSDSDKLRCISPGYNEDTMDTQPRTIVSMVNNSGLVSLTKQSSEKPSPPQSQSTIDQWMRGVVAIGSPLLRDRSPLVSRRLSRISIDGSDRGPDQPN